jgi:drug/metabolite transporter (DMT)-like permease
MWILCALVSAVGAAGTSFSLKRAVEHGGAVVSTVAARLVAAALLACVVAALGAMPTLPAEYWRAAALVLVPEVLGTLFLTLALRAGDLSVVQPLLGLLPPLVMAGGVVFLGEVPTPEAAMGALLVTAGVYCVGLAPGARPLDPLRALARDRAAWFAVACAVSWSAATLVHKRGIAAVGPFPWGVTLALGPALVLAASLPFLPRSPAPPGAPWARLVVLAGASFALQQTGLHLAFGMAQTGYVIAVSATGILISSALGIWVLRERAAPRTRFAGALLVSAGAGLVAVFG